MNTKNIIRAMAVITLLLAVNFSAQAQAGYIKDGLRRLNWPPDCKEISKDLTISKSSGDCTHHYVISVALAQYVRGWNGGTPIYRYGFESQRKTPKLTWVKGEDYPDYEKTTKAPPGISASIVKMTTHRPDCLVKSKACYRINFKQTGSKMVPGTYYLNVDSYYDGAGKIYDVIKVTVK